MLVGHYYQDQLHIEVLNPSDALLCRGLSKPLSDRITSCSTFQIHTIRTFTAVAPAPKLLKESSSTGFDTGRLINCGLVGCSVALVVPPTWITSVLGTVATLDTIMFTGKMSAKRGVPPAAL